MTLRPTHFLYLLLCAWFILASQAFAQSEASNAPSVDLAEEAGLHFDLGIEAYRQGRLQTALEHLLQSNRLVPNRNVVFNIARTYELKKDYDEAFRHYTEYVALEADIERRAAGEAAIDRLRGKIALVQIVSDPPGAAVYVDRRDLGARGRTPQALALTPGEHQILVELDGYAPDAAPASVAIGDAVQVSFLLEQILGTVRVDGTPAGAEIRVGDESGPVVGTLPGDVEIPPGARVLVVSAPGHQTVRQLNEVEVGRTTQTVIDLPLLLGSLVVNTYERDALVEIDGRAAGFTPAVLEVPSGEHQLRVSLRGYRPFEQQITVPPGGSITADVRLHSLREVVAASRVAQAIEDAPASISLITAEEIRAFGYQNVYQALGGTRGVYQSDDLTYKSLGFRGYDTPGDYGNHVLVTMDGHTMNDDQVGASYGASDLVVDLADVERIEIVRGPGSALYGSNAFFGVVNVVTNKGTPDSAPHVSVTADTESTLRGRGGVGLGDDERGLWLSAAGATSQGRDYQFDEFVDIPRGNATGESLNSDGYTARTFHGKAWLDDLTLQGFHHGRTKEIPTGAFGTILGDPRAEANDHRTFGELRYEPKLGDKAELYARAWLDAYSYRGQFPYGPKSVYTDSWEGRWLGVEPRLVVRPDSWLNLTVGAETRQHFAAKLQSETSAGDLILDERPTFEVYSGYGIVELVGGDWVRLSAGGRFDLFNTPEAVGEQLTSFNPRLALILKPGDLDVFKLMGGTAFRAPSVYEFLYDDGGLTQQVSDGLVPERILTAEAEYSHALDEATHIVGAVYVNAIEDLVGTRIIPGTGGVFQYANTEDTIRTMGVEYELRRDWRQGWMAAAQHSMQRTRAGTPGEGSEIINSPPHLISLKAAAPLVAGVTNISTVVRSESPRLRIDGDRTGWAHIVDATVTGRLPQVPARWGVGVRNLLDWRYGYPGGADLRMAEVPQPGRGVFATVTVQP